MKGITAFKQIGLLPDDLLEDALEVLDGFPVRSKRENKLGGIRRFLNSGWGVAAICTIVSMGILTGIVWSVWHGPFAPYPPMGESGLSDSEHLTDSAVTEVFPGEIQSSESEMTTESQTEPTTEGILHEPVVQDGLTFVSAGDGTCRIDAADVNLKGAVIVPETSPFGDRVTAIANYAFRDCTMITSMTIPDSVISIGSGAFRGCNGLMSIVMPQKISHMGTAVFQQCTGIKSIVMPSGLEILPRQTFETCTELTSVEFKDGLTKIEDGAFNGCSRLSVLHIPGTLMSVGNSAFLNCCGLSTVYYDGNREDWHRINVHKIGNEHLEGVEIVAQN